MRAQSIYDREGNSYRHARAEQRQKELQERMAQEEKWAEYYKKVLPNTQKEYRSDWI